MTKRKHEDTSVSLYPMGFEEALKKLSDAPKTADRKTRTAAPQRFLKAWAIRSGSVMS